MRPPSGRIDFDATELERLDVRSGPPDPAAASGAGARVGNDSAV